MVRQVMLFAVAGIAVAVLAGGAGDLTLMMDTEKIFGGGLTLTSTYVGLPWAHVRAVAATGAVAGALIGIALYGFGIRITAVSRSRLGRVTAAGLVGVVLGLLPALIYVGSALVGLNSGESVAFPPSLLLILYGVSAVLAYGAALFAIWLVLRASADDFVGRTMRCTALLLPVGTLVATGAGVGAAWFYEFTTSAYCVSVVITVVTLAISLTFAASRSMALRQRVPVA